MQPPRPDADPDLYPNLFMPPHLPPGQRPPHAPPPPEAAAITAATEARDAHLVAAQPAPALAEASADGAYVPPVPLVDRSRLPPDPRPRRHRRKRRLVRRAGVSEPAGDEEQPAGGASIPGISLNLPLPQMPQIPLPLAVGGAVLCLHPLCIGLALAATLAAGLPFIPVLPEARITFTWYAVPDILGAIKPAQRGPALAYDLTLFNGLVLPLVPFFLVVPAPVLLPPGMGWGTTPRPGELSARELTKLAARRAAGNIDPGLPAAIAQEEADLEDEEEDEDEGEASSGGGGPRIDEAHFWGVPRRKAPASTRAHARRHGYLLNNTNSSNPSIAGVPEPPAGLPAFAAAEGMQRGPEGEEDAPGADAEIALPAQPAWPKQFGFVQRFWTLDTPWPPTHNVLVLFAMTMRQPGLALACLPMCSMVPAFVDSPFCTLVLQQPAEVAFLSLLQVPAELLIQAGGAECDCLCPVPMAGKLNARDCGDLAAAMAAAKAADAAETADAADYADAVKRFKAVEEEAQAAARVAGPQVRFPDPEPHSKGPPSVSMPDLSL